MPKCEKIKIELSPYGALTILSFLREFIKKDDEVEYHFQSLAECIDEFENEIYSKSSIEQIEDGINEAKVNSLIGKSPPIRK